MSQDMFAPLAEGELDGYVLRRTQARAEQVAAMANLIGDVREGRIPSYYLREAIAPTTAALIRSIQGNYPGIIRVTESMTTSDFASLTGDVLQRTMMARFSEFPSPWRQFANVVTLSDFRQVDALAVDGLEGQWGDVPEGDEITYGALGESKVSYKPKKFAKGAKLSFELMVNDRLEAFSEIPARLGRGGARTIAKFVTSLYVGAAGPLATVFTAGNKNIVTGNPALNVDSLAAAWGLLRSQVDADGEPIMAEAAVLVVPPSLEVVARNILSAQYIQRTTQGGASGVELQAQNWITSGITLVVDPYIEVIATSNAKTSWFLFASPAVGRAAIEVGLMRGFEQPRLYQKVANTATIGGGVDQMAGDFATMSQSYKGVLIFGGAAVWARSAVASDGKGS